MGGAATPLRGSGAVVRSIGVGDRGALEDLVRAVDAARIRTVIDQVFAFADARAAFRHLQGADHVGKIVIRMGG